MLQQYQTLDTMTKPIQLLNVFKFFCELVKVQPYSKTHPNYLRPNPLGQEEKKKHKSQKFY